MSNSKFTQFNLDPALAEAVAAASEQEIIEGIIRLEDPKQIPPEFRIVSQFIRICTGRFRAADTWTIRRHPNVVSLKAARPLGISQLSEAPATNWQRVKHSFDRTSTFTGKGVIVAMLDFGLDFGHRNFLNSDGSTRVRALWHQGAPCGPAHLNRYGYGRIFSQQEINAALLESDPYQALGYLPWISDSGHGSHGTHTTDIAAGNGRAPGSRRGIAPEAEILFVHLSTPRSAPGANLGDSVRMLEALDFVHRSAGPQPCAINLSVGRTAGSHDGTSPFEEGMHELLRLAPGRAIAQSAGNYRSAHLATHGLLREGEERELKWTIPPQGNKPTEIDAWYSGNDRFRVRVLSPTGRQWVEAPLGHVVDLKRDDGELIGRLYHRKSDPNNNDNHIDVFLYPNAPAGIWKLRLLGEYVINGRFHAWIERETSSSGNQARFDAAITSASYTLGTIATSPLVLTVGAIDSHAAGRPLAIFSSCGPTRDERRDKPELLAPGVRILAARSIPKDAEQQESLLVELSGTSMAAPHVTGSIAAMYEAAGRLLSIDEIRDCLQRSAEPATDACQDNCCGWGRLNIAAAIGAARQLREPMRLNSLSEIDTGSNEMAANGSSDVNHDDFFERAETAVRRSYGKRQASETSFLEWLLRELAGSSPAAGFTPATLYRAALNEGSAFSQTRLLDLIGVASQPLDCGLRAGDWMVRNIPGTGDIGHVSVLASGDLMDPGALEAVGIAGEGSQAGQYAVVVEAGAFPHTRSRPFARRLLDARGRVPPHTVILRPKYPGVDVATSAASGEPDAPGKLLDDGDPPEEASYGSAADSDDQDSDGRSADSALIFEDDPEDRDPALSGDPDDERLAIVWARSDALRALLHNRHHPDEDDRLVLKASLIRQLPMLWLYWQMHVFQTALKRNSSPSKTVTLFILLFPGEARDNTGIKDLNDNVFGQWWNGIYQQKRYDAIAKIFDDKRFAVAAQTYKTAFIATYEGTRKEFAKKLVELDEALRVALLDTLQRAYDDDKTSENQKKAISALRKKLSKKGYRFDFFFGMKTLEPKSDSRLTNVYLLVTEALKGAALARLAAKSRTLKTRSIQKVAQQPGVNPDSKALDPRGKEYDWNAFLKCSNLAETIKGMVLKGQVPDVTVEMNSIYVDTVWTFAFIEYKNLYWGNSDVIRDVRKKKLEQAPLSGGNVTYSFNLQKDILELWLVVLNMLDFVKSFESAEFGGKLVNYHDTGLQSFLELGHPDSHLDWDKLEYVLTHDSRLRESIAVFDSASEYQFYTAVSDYDQRIFFSMDIRDLGVALMLLYENSNREVNFRRYSDQDLMNETFRATDPIDVRRRTTYDTVLVILKKYYDRLVKDATGAHHAAEQAFGESVDTSLGSFAAAVQIMLGGDEIYVATHPLFARDVSAIIGEIDPLDLRASVAFSKATQVAHDKQRESNQKSHQRAMRHVELAPGTLKRLERTHRRIERLIDMIESNPKKAPRGAGYREELAQLPLRKLYARWRNDWPPASMNKEARAKAYEALLSGEPGAADDAVELVDFAAGVVDRKKLEEEAKKLEEKVRRDVGPDNVQIHAPPIVKVPKWVEKLLDWLLKDKDKKKQP